MSNAAKKATLTTPFGKTEWFSLNKTDKFGNYTCTLVLEDSPETHKLISQIDEIGEGKRPYEKQSDGSFKLKLKSKSKGNKKDGTSYVINSPVIYNAAGKKVEGLELEALNVGNGSELRAKIEVSSYVMVDQATQEILKGVSCKIKSSQISKVVEFSGGNDADLGFDALELGNEPINSEASKDKYDF